MVISPGRGYIFVHIPKTGGTSMALALEARAMADDILIGDTPKAQRRKRRLEKLQAPGRLWKHARLSDIEGMAGLPEPAFVFTLVRNPWTRLVSLYHWARQQTFDHPTITAAKALPFEAFLSDPTMQAAFRNDCASAYVMDRSGTIRCNAFVRLEHLSTDLTAVEAHLGFTLDIPHVNRSDHPSAAGFYTAFSKDLVAEIYADDIARFGYSFPA